ncbi:MAG: NAD+ synthase [Fidelibacterota bacterium]|nr:MAG: NAD+ synthase [Candidatus Neomarinimicrobiota bacterium]
MPLMIALAQINPTVGDIQGNLDLHRRILTQVGDQAEVVIFPECALPGYPAQDLLFEKAFLTDLQVALDALAGDVSDQWVIVGTVRQKGGKLYNTAVVLHNAQIHAYRDKSLLPTYDVFDEDRYFTPADKIEPVALTLSTGDALRTGLHICEDLWDRAYDIKVCDVLVEQGVDLFVNISASPFRVDRDPRRRELIVEKVRSLKKPYLYCNLVGGQDELVFDGHSLACDESGQLVSSAAAFKEDLIYIPFPLDTMTATAPATTLSRVEELNDAIVLGIRDYFRKTGHREALVGLSGGVDSSVVAALAVQALGSEQVIALTMPAVYSSSRSEMDARTVAQNLGIRFEVLPIEPLRREMQDMLEPFFQGTESGVAEENLQARIRGTLLMTIANKREALLLTAGNKTEVALGYATLYGDMAGTLAPIGDVSKSDVYGLARYINDREEQEVIPQTVLDKVPSAELAPGQVDPFDYEVVSPLVDELILNRATDEELVDKGYNPLLVTEIRALIVKAEYKRRQAAPSIRVTGKAFGVGRRYPIVNRYGH